MSYLKSQDSKGQSLPSLSQVQTSQNANHKTKEIIKQEIRPSLQRLPQEQLHKTKVPKTKQTGAS